MAPLKPRPKNRVHFAVKFAAGAMRVAAVFLLLTGTGGALSAFNVPLVFGGQELPVLVASLIAAACVVFALIYALILWGFADGLVLLADVDDAQRETQRQIADLVLEQRLARGPFHAEATAAAKETRAS